MVGLLPRDRSVWFCNSLGSLTALSVCVAVHPFSPGHALSVSVCHSLKSPLKLRVPSVSTGSAPRQERSVIYCCGCSPSWESRCACSSMTSSSPSFPARAHALFSKQCEQETTLAWSAGPVRQNQHLSQLENHPEVPSTRPSDPAQTCVHAG